MSTHLSAEDVRALVDGRVPARGARAVDEHLLSCEGCRRRVREEHDDVARTESSDGGAPGAVDEAVVSPSEGRYEFVRTPGGALEELGRGGFGKVVLVRDTTLGRDVAMKRLTSERLARAKGTSEARLLREARVLGQLEHPAIVPLHELGRGADGQLYYTMRRIRGRTLAEALKDAKTLDERLRLLPHVLTACHAVAYAHSRGVVHRDLKPHNVMLDRFGATYLIDWGLARARGLDDADEQASPTESGALRLVTSDETIGDADGRIGTAAYMSPEHLEGPRALVDERSDVWGLGALLYEVLTGRPPRDRATATWRFPPRPAHEVVPDAPRDLAALCEKAMAQRREDRYPSAEALAADLDAWLQGRQVSAHAYRPRELLSRFVRTNRVAVLVAAGFLVALLTLGVGSYLRVRSERNQSRAFAHLILGQVLERLTATRDDEFTRRLIGEVTEWLNRQGASDDAASVAWAWFLLAREAYRSGEPVAEFIAACLRAADDVDDARARAAAYGCRVIDGPSAQGGVNEATAAALQALESEVPRDGQEESAPWIEARVVHAYKQALVANLLVDLTAELQAVDRLLVLSRKSLARATDRAAALADVARALARRSLVASSLSDGEGAVRFGEESVAVARQAVAVRADRNTLEVLSDNLGQLVTIHRWHPRESPGPDADAPLVAEARRLFQARLVLTHDSLTARLGYGLFLLDLGEPDEAWRHLAQADWSVTSALFKSQFGFAALATGHHAAVVEHAADFKAEADFDCEIILGLALGLAGKLVEGAERFERARTLPTVSGWPAPTMTRFASELKGPLAPGVRRFVEDFERGQRENEDDFYFEALNRLEKEWRAMAAAAR